MICALRAFSLFPGGWSEREDDDTRDELLCPLERSHVWSRCAHPQGNRRNSPGNAYTNLVCVYVGECLRDGWKYTLLLSVIRYSRDAAAAMPITWKLSRTRHSTRRASRAFCMFAHARAGRYIQTQMHTHLVHSLTPPPPEEIWISRRYPQSDRKTLRARYVTHPSTPTD